MAPGCAVMAVVDGGGLDIDGRSLMRAPYFVVVDHDANGTSAGYPDLVFLVLPVLI